MIKNTVHSKYSTNSHKLTRELIQTLRTTCARFSKGLMEREKATHHHQRKLLHGACVSILLDSFLLAVAAPAALAAHPP